MELLAINHHSSEKRILVPVAEVLPCSGCFITCMGAHFPAVELDNAIRFSTLSRMSGFLWHSSKWACQFGCFLYYMLRIKVLACSLDTNLDYVTTMLQLHPSSNHYVFGCIAKDRYYVTPALSWIRVPLLNFLANSVNF